VKKRIIWKFGSDGITKSNSFQNIRIGSHSNSLKSMMLLL
jgi:hypothetical protein